jgi:hypothetical protein
MIERNSLRLSIWRKVAAPCSGFFQDIRHYPVFPDRKHRPDDLRQTLNSIALHAVNLSATCLQADQISSPTSSPLTAFAALL